MSFIIPAVLPSSRRELEENIETLAGLPGVSHIQIDVVDGKFAAPASWPYTAPVEFSRMVEHGEMLPAYERIIYEIDLMCLEPDHAVHSWLALGARRFTFHAEALSHPDAYLAQARERYAGGLGAVADLISFGLALNVGSDLALLERALTHVDYVQFMGIARIGAQGQPFDDRVLEKIRAFRFHHPNIPVQVDGGVSRFTAQKLVDQDVTNLVVGSAILKASNPSKALAELEAMRKPS